MSTPQRRERRTRLSPWVELAEVEVGPPDDARLYHALAVPDYATALALRPDGKVALIRQYRPIIGRHCWELPSGMVDAGESPAAAAIRETLEETGHAVRAHVELASLQVDGGRLLNRAHAIVAVLEPEARAPAEPGIELAFLDWPRFAALVAAGGLVHANHTAIVGQAVVDQRVAAFLETHGLRPPWPR